MIRFGLTYPTSHYLTQFVIRFGLTYYSPELMMSQATPHPHRLDPIDLMEHPLRVMVMVAQSHAGMWKRNGERGGEQIWLRCVVVRITYSLKRSCRLALPCLANQARFSRIP